MTHDDFEADASTDAGCTETTEATQSSNERTLTRIYHKLVGNPFFPLVFWGKAAEGFVTGVHPWDFTILAAATTILWAISDAINVDVRLTGNKIK